MTTKDTGAFLFSLLLVILVGLGWLHSLGIIK